MRKFQTNVIYLYRMTTKTLLISCCTLLNVYTGFSQTTAARLSKAMQEFEADPQMRHAIVSLMVADAGTGKTVYAHHEQIGLAPASSQKIFTSVAAFELLGKDYRYKTIIGYDGAISNGVLNGNLHIKGFGDPTLGSWRWVETKPEAVLGRIVNTLKKNNITKIDGNLLINDSAFSLQPLPGGWIWDDIGNYYGAGCWAINWRENQYDMVLTAGKKEGEATVIKSATPAPVQNEITTGKKGSGDNAYIYLPPYSATGFTQGTIPPGENSFTISGALPDGPAQLAQELKQQLSISGEYKVHHGKESWPGLQQTLATIYSPTLDSINYWFLRKSINLYGEALLKTMAYEKTGYGSTDKGVELLRNFWSERGIDKGAINIMDGSGLSPQNRVTTDAEVKVLQYAKTRPWYNAFYNAMPEYNGMKMKSGTIGGSKAFAGYHKQYVFSIIVNNFNGSAGEVVKKMYKVLDVLK
jgi:D-alanyl-D-alanine carboxypeptidase/D-alanyl-D-alanine-endopeptidase (penicillin-binding protein 4)